MKKYFVWILSALCALLSMPALAAENHSTQITTTLPREHMITVVCAEGGAVRVKGNKYTGTSEFNVDRLAAFVLEAVPETGYRLSQVMAQTARGVHMTGNTVSIASVYEDKTLTLSFEREPVELTPTASPVPTASPTAAPMFDLPPC